MLDFLTRTPRRRQSAANGAAQVLLIADRPFWAYDSIAKSLIKYADDPHISFDIEYMKGGTRSIRDIHKDYDLLFFLGWQSLGEMIGGRIKARHSFLDRRRVITGIHSHHSWDNQQTLPDRSVPPPAELIDFLARFAGVNTVSNKLYTLFLGAGLRNLGCTLNGVDTEIFTGRSPVSTDGPLRVGFSGNLKHDWRKGVTEFIEPGCDMPGVEVRLAMNQDDSYVPLEQMPSFYADLDAYLCASSSEGFSLSVLEAAASGIPVVSTRVGGCEDLIIDGINGFLVDRNVDAIRDKIAFLRDNRDAAIEMGSRNRDIVTQMWSWAVRAKTWHAFIKAHLN